MEKPKLSTVMQQAQTALRKYWYVAGLLILCGTISVGFLVWTKKSRRPKCCRKPPHLVLCGSHESGPHVSRAGVGSLWNEDGAGLRR